MIQHRIQNRPPLELVLCQTNPLHILFLYSINIRNNILSPSYKRRSLKWADIILTNLWAGPPIYKVSERKETRLRADQ
jgi:hypothetical protein